MSIIHVRQIKSSIEKSFSSLIDLGDVQTTNTNECENIFLSRGLAALAVKILTDVPVEEAANSVTDGY